METPLQVLYAVAGGVLAGTASLLIGGLGALRAMQRRVNELEADHLSLEERHTREVKRRAGQATQEQRRDGLAEARSYLATHRTAVAEDEKLPGRAH